MRRERAPCCLRDLILKEEKGLIYFFPPGFLYCLSFTVLIPSISYPFCSFSEFAVHFLFGEPPLLFKLRKERRASLRDPCLALDRDEALGAAVTDQGHQLLGLKISHPACPPRTPCGQGAGPSLWIDGFAVEDRAAGFRGRLGGAVHGAQPMTARSALPSSV